VRRLIGDDGVIYSPPNPDDETEFYTFNEGMFPALRMFGLVGDPMGFTNFIIPTEIKLTGEKWHVYDVSMLPLFDMEGDTVWKTQVIWIPEAEFKMLNPIPGKRWDKIVQMLTDIGLTLEDPTPDVKAIIGEKLDLKCGPGRTPRDILYSLMEKYKLEITISGTVVKITKPGNAGIGTFSSLPRTLSVARYGTVLSDGTDNPVVTGVFNGVGRLPPGFVFKGGDPIFSGLKVVYSSTYSVDTQDIMMVVAMRASRPIDVDTLCHVRLCNNKSVEELISWRSEARNTKSFISTTQGDAKIRFPEFDWFNGEDMGAPPPARSTDRLLPYYVKLQNDAYYCKFPEVYSAYNKEPRYEVLVVLPEKDTTESKQSYVARSIELGTPVPHTGGAELGMHGASDLVFKLPGSTTKAGVQEYGELRWKGGQSAGSNEWTVTTSRTGGLTSTITVKSDSVKIEAGGRTINVASGKVNVT